MDHQLTLDSVQANEPSANLRKVAERTLADVISDYFRTVKTGWTS